nr:biotin/lipoyl-containing protein [uncultured Oscillibacter sp.]
MTNQEIKELISCFENSSLQTMKLSTQEFTIEMSRGAAAAPAVSQAPAAAPIPAAPAREEGDAVKAPLVGTFYAAPAPDQPPFVAVGKRVKKGQTVCLIEAMKMMSEVPAPCDCVIEEILKADGELVAFGEALLRYKPC